MAIPEYSPQWLIKEIFNPKDRYNFEAIKDYFEKDYWAEMFDNFVLAQARDWYQDIINYPYDMKEDDVKALIDLNNDLVGSFAILYKDSKMRSDFYSFWNEERKALLSWVKFLEIEDIIEFDPWLPDSVEEYFSETGPDF